MQGSRIGPANGNCTRLYFIRLRPKTLQLVRAKAGLATAQLRFDTPQVLPDGSASRAAGSFISLTFRRICPYDIFMSVEREKSD
jgi:hypothetical protein